MVILDFEIFPHEARIRSVHLFHIDKSFNSFFPESVAFVVTLQSSWPHNFLEIVNLLVKLLL